MSFNLESNEKNETGGAPEVEIDSEQLAETEETAENFDDCSPSEVQDSNGEEVDSEALREAEENYEDCEGKLQEMEEENPGLEEEDYNDCGKESQGQYAAEVTYTTDGEISSEEASEELQEAYDDCDDPEDMQQLKDNANENEHIEVQEAEVVERPENTETGEEVTEEDYEEAQEELEEAEETLEDKQEAAEEYQNNLENETNEKDDNAPEGSENINNEASEETEESEDDVSEDTEENEEASETEESDAVGEGEKTSEEEKVGEDLEEEAEKGEAEEVDEPSDEASEETETEVSETEKEELGEDVAREVEEETETELSDEEKEQITEEVSEEIESEAAGDKLTDAETAEIVEDKKDDAVSEAEEKSDVKDDESEASELAEEGAEAEDGQSLQERIDGALENKEITSSEIDSLREEHSAELKGKIEEKNAVEAELKEKFDEVMTKEKGSEEYRQLLDEHNAIQDRKTSLDEEIAAMEEKQDLLDKKSIELRDAQIEKGAEAIAASAVTLEGAKALQERYDSEYYAQNSDKTELGSIREESCASIKELSEEKESIRKAMDAKMDEIAEYVMSNNMDRYDTANDSHYRQLSEEYNALKESYDKIDYTIVKLDENNKAITEQLGDEYVSMVELPPSSEIAEVNNGTDVPGETDYFVDKEKASEALSPFKQENWEKMTPLEQKRAVSKLAEYNAEILGVEDKPRIIYYNAEDPEDFGGYSAKQNAIYINEYNMHDAAETADTIAHEYRHKYQHERAEKLETERDLEFKEGFENYIRAEDDYMGYKQQLVERDAREYAERVRDEIASSSEGVAEGQSRSVEQGSLGADYGELNPEKGTTFEKVSVDELPEDFQQKERSRRAEGLEQGELDELRSSVKGHYENGKELGERVREFDTYKEHCNIKDGHIEKVRVKTLETADALEAHFRENDYGGLFSPDIDKRTVEVMALYHDTGMDGNISAEGYDAEKAAYTADEAKRERFVSGRVKKAEKEADFDRAAAEKKANEEFERIGFEAHFRADHSLESAVHALRDREAISKAGVNVDEVAMGCLVHSKSCSGVKNMESEAEWKAAIDRLSERVDEFNKTHPDEQIYFDSSFLLNDDGSFDKESLAKMRSEAMALRIGDANGHDCNTKTSQNGKKIEFSLERESPVDELPNDLERKIEQGIYEPYFAEVQEADVRIDGKRLGNGDDPDGVYRMFAVGEGNFESLSCEVEEDGTVKQVFEICDGNAFPLSTQYCIEQRLEEYKTGKPLEYTPVIKLGGNCSAEAYESYRKFADRIERESGVRVEVL